LFFVYAYFVTALEILKRVQLVDTLEQSPQNVPMEIWDKILFTAKLNIELLDITDQILDRYFSDSKVDEAVGKDVRKFLKSQDTLNRHESILMRLIDIVLSRNHKFIDDWASVVS
jgi:hypothetical protein